MNRFLPYIAGIFITGCCIATEVTNKTAAGYCENNRTEQNILQKDGTVVEYGYVRNRKPAKLLEPRTLAYYKNTAVKTAHLYK